MAEAQTPSSTLSWPVVFRIAASLALAAVLIQARQNPLDQLGLFWWALVILVVLLPAIGMLFSEGWARSEAVTMDCTLGAFATGLSIGTFCGRSHSLPGNWAMWLVIMAIGFTSLVECIYLLARSKAGAWSAGGCLAFAVLFLILGRILGEPF